MVNYRKCVLLAAFAAKRATAFVGPSTFHFHSTSSLLKRKSSPQETVDTAISAASDPLGLTPELRKLTDAFQAIPDDKLRYKQLLYMASNGLDPMDENLKIPENKVPGCLSTVHVDGVLKFDQERNENLVHFVGDSDGLLTKGLVALLVRGLSGNTAADIQLVDPAFIQEAKISQSLTPGRNNGFLNMLQTMKRKALELEAGGPLEDAEKPSKDGEANSSNTDRSKYDTIMDKLQALKPEKIELVDNSHEHVGHAGVEGDTSGETHFEVSIVAEAFEGLSLVKRHQLIYMMLGDVMPEIHALQIQAFTPEEVANRREV